MEFPFIATISCGIRDAIATLDEGVKYLTWDKPETDPSGTLIKETAEMRDALERLAKLADKWGTIDNNGMTPFRIRLEIEGGELL
jgi:hypothetical protein